MKPSREWLFRIVIGAGLYLFAEAAASATLRILERTSGLAYRPMELRLRDDQLARIQRLLAADSTYNKFDVDLGWTVRPSTSVDQYRANAAGLRASREYAERAPAGVLRVAAFGDSYTHGDGEDNDDTWPAIAERLDASLEVLNYGVSSYGVDQAFLRYRAEGERYHPRIVVIGFMTDDIGRQLSVYRPFLRRDDRFPFSKPRFVLAGDGLQLVPNPLRRPEDYAVFAQDQARALRQLGPNDYSLRTGYFRGALDFLPSVRLFKITRGRWATGDPYDPGSEAMAVTTRVLVAFVRLVEQRGARPLVVILPDSFDLARFRADGSRRYQSLIAFLESSRLPYLDLAEPLARSGSPAALFNPVKHYSAAGNRRVAETLLPRLRAIALP